MGDKITKGDIVQCINNESVENSGLEVGKIYTCLETNGDIISVMIGEVIKVYCATRFKLMTDLEQPPPCPFEIGQKVRCIDNNGFKNLTIGECYEILETSLFNTDWFIRILVDDYTETMLCYRFEAIAPDSLSFFKNPKIDYLKITREVCGG